VSAQRKDRVATHAGLGMLRQSQQGGGCLWPLKSREFPPRIPRDGVVQVSLNPAGQSGNAAGILSPIDDRPVGEIRIVRLHHPKKDITGPQPNRGIIVALLRDHNAPRGPDRAVSVPSVDPTLRLFQLGHGILQVDEGEMLFGSGPERSTVSGFHLQHAVVGVFPGS
jgi:hypothetical protein